jgi:arsenate reductase
MIIYGIKNCNTMQKAFTILTQKGIEYSFHDYKKLGISESKIKEWFEKEPWERFINKQGQTWKKLDDSVKESIKTSNDAIPLMQKYTSLIKRPILESTDKFLIGFEEEVYLQLK